MEGYQSLRGATPNQDVIRQAEAQIRDAQRNISYLEESLRTLQGRRASGGAMLRNQAPSATSLASTPSSGFYQPSNTNTSMDSSIDGRGSQASNGPGSMSSSTSMSSPYPGQMRPYPGDSSSSYLTSSTSDMQNLSSAGRPYDNRNMPRAPGMPDARGPGGGFRSSSGPPMSVGGPAPGRPGEAFNGPMVNRMGTSARKNYTNLGTKEI